MRTTFRTIYGRRQRGTAVTLITFASLLLASTVFCATPGFAQENPKSAKAVIDPKARLVLEKMIKTYRSLKTLNEVIQLRVSPEAVDNNSGVHSFTAKVYLDREKGRANVTKYFSGETWTAMSDGESLYATRSTQPARYTKRSLGEQTDISQSMFNVFVELRATCPGLVIVSGESNWEQMLKEGLTSLSLGKPQIIDGMEVQTVNAIFQADKNTEATITINCFKSDGMLRRIVFETPIQGTAKKQRFTEDHVETKLNIPLPPGLFIFTPAAGDTAVATFD